MAFYIGLSPAWTVAEALKWRRQHTPVISDQSALSELHSVCSSRKVQMNGTRREPNPNWSGAEKIAVRFRKQQPQAIPPSELKCLYFEIDGAFQGGTLSWTSSRQPAWWPVHFASDELITAWLAALRSEARPAEASGSMATAVTRVGPNLRGKELKLALKSWAETKLGAVVEATDDLPDRDELLRRARAEVSENTKEGDIRELRRRYASPIARKGGARFHRGS